MRRGHPNQQHGRRPRSRLRAMRFALWAQRVPNNELTPRLISDVLGIGLMAAREWRTDYFNAISPIDDTDLPPYQAPTQPRTTP